MNAPFLNGETPKKLLGSDIGRATLATLVGTLLFTDAVMSYGLPKAQSEVAPQTESIDPQTLRNYQLLPLRERSTQAKVEPKPLQTLLTYARFLPSKIAEAGAKVRPEEINDEQFKRLYSNPEYLRAYRKLFVEYGAQAYLFVNVSSQSNNEWKLAQQQAISRASGTDFRPIPTNDLSDRKGVQTVTAGGDVFFSSGVIIVTGVNSVTFGYTERGRSKGFVTLEENRLESDGNINKRIYANGDYPGASSAIVETNLY